MPEVTLLVLLCTPPVVAVVGWFALSRPVRRAE